MMSPVEHGFGEDGYPLPRNPSGVGADLRETRERLGWTLPAVAASLRIRLPYLEAIEAGRFAELPGNAYAAGFVRTYAGAMGLDTDEISRRFRAEAAGVNRKTELTFPAPVPERGVPAGTVILLGVVLIIAAYVGWYRLSDDRQPTAEPVSPVPEHLAALAPLPPPPASSASATSAAGLPVTQPAPQPALPTPILVPVPPIASPTPAPAPTPAPSPDGTRIVVRAKADAWVQVRDKLGNVVFNRTMRAGETWPVPAKPALLLTVGNAGGTELLVDGVVAPSLGADGAVRSDLPLDADLLRDGKLAVPPPVAAKLAPQR